MHPLIIASIRRTTDQLTNDELAAIYMAVTAGFDPRNVIGYEKAKSLFTEADGTKCHAETLKVLDSIVAERIK